MKDSYYFSHDSNARSDERILAVRAKYGAKGYGIYFMIIEMLREANAQRLLKHYSSIAYGLHEQTEDVQDIVENFNLFEIDGDYFFSPSLKKRMIKKEEINEKRRQAGKRGGEANAQRLLKQTSTIAKPLKEKKGKERKEYNTCAISEFQKKSFELANHLVGAILKNNPNFKNSPETLKGWAEDIEKMLRLDGRSVEDSRAVIDFAQKSSFWRSNILSGAKLREKFDTLYMQKDQPQSGIKQIFSSTLSKQQQL